MNRVILSGRLTKDPQTYEKDGKISSARFSLAVQRDFKDAEGNYGADFPNCVAFGKNAEFVSKYFHKGSWMETEGRLSTGSYTNKDGQKVYTTDVVIDKAGFGGASKADNNAAAKNNSEVEATPQAKVADEGFMNIPDSIEDLPFGG